MRNVILAILSTAFVMSLIQEGRRRAEERSTPAAAAEYRQVARQAVAQTRECMSLLKCAERRSPGIVPACGVEVAQR